jgi:hypothetical protein
MWNVRYAVALWHPIRHKVSLCEGGKVMVELPSRNP